MDNKSILSTRLKERKSGFELLRIIAMIMIIAHHIAFFTDYKDNNLIPYRIWLRFILMGGKIAVNLFVLITGYHSIQKQSINTVKIVRLWLQVFSYSIIIYLIAAITGLTQFSPKNILYAFLPTINSKWSFFTTYLLLVILSPYINRMISSLGKRKIFGLLFLLGFIWSAITTATGSAVGSNDLLWFIFLYSCGGYIRLYGVGLNWSAKKYLLTAVSVIMVTFALTLAMDYYPPTQSFSTTLYDNQSLFLLFISLLLFFGFSKIDIGSNYFINFVASLTFGIILIHTEASIQNTLWSTYTAYLPANNSFAAILYSLAVLFLIFVVCALIEYIRLFHIERLFSPVIYFISDKILAIAQFVEESVTEEDNPTI